jgi:hypothetical protein
MNAVARSMIAAVCFAAFALPAAAQQAMPGPGPRGDRPTDQQREEIRQKMEAIRIVRLTEALKLDEKTAAKFIPIITSLDQQRRTLLMENQQLLQEMRALVHEQAPDEGKLRAAIGKIERKVREIASLREKEFEAVKSNLTVTQQAQYLLFHQEFQREMRGMVEGARGRRSGMMPGPGPGQGPMQGDQPPPDR